VARTARRDVIGLLVEKQVPYTEVEADALVTEAKRLSKESGRTVRAEAELLLSRDRGSRLRDLRDQVAGASELLAAIVVEVDDLRADSGDDDGELADIMATMAASCEPFIPTPTGGSTPTVGPGEPRGSSAADVGPTPVEPVEGDPS
jgi:hypothetical protein